MFCLEMQNLARCKRRGVLFWNWNRESGKRDSSKFLQKFGWDQVSLQRDTFEGFKEILQRNNISSYGSGSFTLKSS